MKENVEHLNAVDILIFNDNHELALQKRAANDKSFPSHWDFSAGGHIDPGEENKKAAEREIFEELGISGIITFISKEHLEYPSWKPGVFRKGEAYLYKMLYNGSFTIDNKEVEKVAFFSLSEIQKMIDEGIKFHPEFLLIWEKGLVRKALLLN